VVRYQWSNSYTYLSHSVHFSVLQVCPGKRVPDKLQIASITASESSIAVGNPIPTPRVNLRGLGALVLLPKQRCKIAILGVW
jgi:hypothetical protein